MGKCTEPVKTLLPPAIKEKFTALAVLKAGSESEYLRQIIEEKVLGEFEMMRLRANGRQRTSGNGQE